MTTLPVWEHWDAMIAVSHSVLGSADEARDCAAEAVAQVLERNPADVANLEAFMVTVAKRRAIDRVRAAQRSRRRDQILAGQISLSAPDVAEDVVARAEARWVDEQARILLKPKVYSLVQMLADAVPMQEAAKQLGMTERAAESHLLRARRTIRAALAKTFGVLVAILACGRRHSPAAPAVVIAGATLALSSVLIPAAPDQQPVPPQPPARPAHAAVDHAVSEGVSPKAASRSEAVRPARPERPATGPETATTRPVRTPVAQTPIVGLNTYSTDDGEQDTNPVDQAITCLENLQITLSYAGCQAER